jgi:hypothetical protein
MSYEIQFTDDYERRRIAGDLPSELVDQIEKVLLGIAEDPWGRSRIPPSPPFVPVGRLCETICTYGDIRYFVRFFFHIDDEKQMVVVRRSSMQPPFRPKK